MNRKNSSRCNWATLALASAALTLIFTSKVNPAFAGKPVKPPESPIADPTQAGEIHGILADPGTAGVDGLEVHIPGRSFYVRIGDDGSFTLHYVPAGTWSLVVSRHGYRIRQLDSVQVTPRTLTDLGTISVYLDADQDGSTTEFDCNDADASVFPGALEVCDGKDNDCDGQTDEGAGDWYYRDQDGDGYGNPDQKILACTQPPGYVPNNRDCSDGDPSFNPGAIETFDGMDNDCDGEVDECYGYWLYADLDRDGFGGKSYSAVCLPEPTPGFAANNWDCDDSNPDINPLAAELPGDGKDNDCDGMTDEIGPG